ncbi:threonine synthase [Numidum massiliense]|uniref:threonine synthase n=1 Tax=Numidum massiliense TaxID=1522315 RepID=UPI0006D59D13|nr:threonine synthase [Numidum massiliense]
MSYSYVSHLSCSSCKEVYDAQERQQLCHCGSPLLVTYRLDDLQRQLTREAFEGRASNMWRYHELLPVQEERCVISFAEGMTPLFAVSRIGNDMGITQLYVKDESALPSGTFKARGAAVGVSKARELGIRSFIIPTNGNAGAAWALYAARAGMKAHVVISGDAPDIAKRECAVSGADVYVVDGLINEAGQIAAAAAKQFNLYDVSTLKEPYRVEGKKTMGLEIAEQFQWGAPEVIVYPTGGGVGLLGIFKAMTELKALGWLEGNVPRLVAVQAAGCAPIARAWTAGVTDVVPWEQAYTIAFGINVPQPRGASLVLEALKETNGCAVTVTDEAIVNEQRQVAAMEGVFLCPEGAAAFAAARQLRASGWIDHNERVVVLNTGAGLKYPHTVPAQFAQLQRGERIRGV